MKLIWLGHGSWRIECGADVILIDPWLTGNPAFDDTHRADALNGVTQILITHGHSDHTAEIVEISQETNAPVSGMIELAGYLHGKGAVAGHAFNKGGTLSFADTTVTLVPASHSSSIAHEGRSVYMGAECGFVLKGGAHTVYFSGDTTIMADMDWIADYHKPDIGILSAGGYYTMDMAAAAYAAKRYFNFKTVIPSHYKTFPALEQSVDALRDGLPGVTVIEPEVMATIDP